MDTAASRGSCQTPANPCYWADDQPHISPSQLPNLHPQHRLCCHGQFPLSERPSVVLHVLTESCLDPLDLARLEATCSFFKNPANFLPDKTLSLPELAALDMCQKRTIFKSMSLEEKEAFKQQCGGSWKLVLYVLKAGELCYRREKCQAIAGPGHSVVVTGEGAVYTFGSNSFGQLGHGNGTVEKELHPRLVKSLHGIRIIQAAAGVGRTMLVSDSGEVYAMGKDSFSDPEHGGTGSKSVSSPHLVESLNGIFIVQVGIGHFFTAVLSREGRVYTFSWGSDAKLCHQTEPQDQVPQLLKGDLEHLPVVQIAAGYCFLLALTCQASSMSVYSVGCGLGGKLGLGASTDEQYPRMIKHFQQLKLQPITVAAGAWHAAVVGQDGRVCTWGWGRAGCLGHGNEESVELPRVVEALKTVKAVHVATGDYTTFVVADNGEVYSFGCGQSSSLGHVRTSPEGQARHRANLLRPELVVALKERKERVVQISLTNSVTWNAHTFALTDSGRLYAFGAGNKGQLGIELLGNERERENPELVDINLN